MTQKERVVLTMKVRKIAEDLRELEYLAIAAGTNVYDLEYPFDECIAKKIQVLQKWSETIYNNK